MLRIAQIKLPIGHEEKEIRAKAAKILRLPEEELLSFRILRRSIDARKKGRLLYVYTVEVEVEKEKQVLRRTDSQQVTLVTAKPYHFPDSGTAVFRHPPVIIGSGPAGLFCGLMLAKAGYCPIILERGEEVDKRAETVERFWQNGLLEENSNVQFGEGGAGTFSDGKLNTLVKDPMERNRKVLESFVEHGADPSILYEYKPHIGTDMLRQVVKNIRNHVLDLGGSVLFQTQVTDLVIEGGRISQVTARTLGPKEEILHIPAEAVILAVGHSARDTFSMLLKKGIPMEPKAFAVGLRIQHPQEMINESQYGMKESPILGPASYKVAYQTATGRGVYSFCMCPGGYVVNASSEPGRLAVNGMSNHDRGGKNANSALIVTVTPADFPGASPLAGVEYQRRLEALAYEYGNGRIPVQLYGDFKAGKESRDWGQVEPELKGGYQFANLRELLPEYLSLSIIEGMEQFEQKIHGFSRYDGILAGVESRTSSPVRIPRDERFESQIKGMFPCGEGAGYAGGIMSAAMDGMKTAEEIGRRYRPLKGIGNTLK